MSDTLKAVWPSLQLDIMRPVPRLTPTIGLLKRKDDIRGKAWLIFKRFGTNSRS
ncbi:hypothetical protein BTIS_2084 [Bifidobacterium tissieri]|uniref:Uncharacterized protein n=1 Tax=Bifidobacterium tissieri TaxID=1630162 RepID=A0A261F8M2_9BIFI|nr:hypothetical protein BTIS_2084 [Bifidobacterium tissieri]